MADMARTLSGDSVSFLGAREAVMAVPVWPALVITPGWLGGVAVEIRRRELRLGLPGSYVVGDDPNRLGRSRHPDLIKGERLIAGVFEPMDLAVPGGHDVPYCYLVSLGAEMEHR